MMNLASPTAVVSHDAGATNLILAWMLAYPGSVFRPVMEGPAARTWALSFSGQSTFKSIEEALQGAAVLLSGAGWASNLEHDARRHARSHGIYSVAVLDHWVNYRERFMRHGETILPDEFWVTDSYALEQAGRCFPDRKIVLKPNLYLEGMLQKIGKRQHRAISEVLYALEPIRADWGGQEQSGEFQALDYFVTNMSKLGLGPDTRIRLRPHPSDPTGKYLPWMKRNSNIHSVLDDSISLERAIDGADWVVGCESYPLVVALAAGRHVASTLPPWAPACRLPHQGIVHLRDLP